MSLKKYPGLVNKKLSNSIWLFRKQYALRAMKAKAFLSPNIYGEAIKNVASLKKTFQVRLI